MTSDARPGTPRLTARQALAIITGVLVLALVVPPAVATFVAEARLARARRDLAEIVAMLSAQGVGGGEASPAVVLAGRGRLPKTGNAGTGAWLLASRGPLDAEPDPWGNVYLVRMRGADPHSRVGPTPSEDGGARLPILVLSAGPNGVIETAFAQAVGNSGIGGDDVGVLRRRP